jgi:dihydroorotase
MKKTLITNVLVVNENQTFEGAVLMDGNFIAEVYQKAEIQTVQPTCDEVIDGQGKWLIPGVIDDQVHFREPGLTHKGEIYTEAKAAVAGGVTSFMEMPNTLPQTTTQELLEAKYARAAECSLANYSFYMGATNDNLDELLKTDPRTVCGIKVFMGASTGNMLVDNKQTLENIFSKSKALIAVHCEDETTIKQNLASFQAKYGDDIPIKYHAQIRSTEACYLSSNMAVELARKYQSRLHVLHLSTARELSLFENHTPRSEKKITSEVCVHHLWFEDSDYEKLGAKIKWNPAVKTAADKAALREAVNNGLLDIVATDHAPHAWSEKQNNYPKCPSGGPLVQHSLVAMLEMAQQGIFSIEKVVDKMCHAPADIFHVEKRGYIKKGYYADLILVDRNKPWTVSKENILYKCGWSPLEGETFHSQVLKTWVNGNLVYQNGVFDESIKGMRLLFNI